MEMADLEKVIEHLKEIAEYFRVCRSNASFASKAENHFWELQNAASEAAELLKAQEPRVMTYDEMMKAEICFLEVKGIEEIDPFIRYEVDGKSYWSSPYTNNKDNPFELLAEQEEYSINARCWTSRPSDSERENTPWEN